MKNKFLISYDLDDDIRSKAAQDHDCWNINIVPLEENYSKLVLGFKEGGTGSEYYFKRQQLISPIFYHSRYWTRFESEYLIFIVSDSSRFNRYCRTRLDAFISNTLDMLEISSELEDRLRKEKIYYYLCRDAGEIEALTGYKARGMYNLAHDYVISLFNCHYHELVHLLVNYKLQQVPLKTHPFFQEGIAVALGGRGGKEPRIILDLGLFLFESGFVQLQELLSLDSFQATDASLSYPASGLYNLFLMNYSGTDDYLGLYLKYSRAGGRLEVLDADLPEPRAWESFLQRYSEISPTGEAATNPADRRMIFADPVAEVSLDSQIVYFKLSSPILISEAASQAGYISGEFQKQFPDRTYRGEMYLITANPDEVSIYNLYTNNLIMKYVASLSANKPPIEQDGGFCSFMVYRSLFDGDLNSMTIKVMPGAQ